MNGRYKSMEKLYRPSLLITVLAVIVAGAFIGLATAHDSGGTQVHENCEIDHAGEECQMEHGEKNCPMRDGGMMGMSGDCPMENRGGMMGMHGDSSSDHGDCPMH